MPPWHRGSEATVGAEGRRRRRRCKLSLRVAKKRASCAAVDASLSKTGFVLFALLARRLLLVGILEEILGAGCQESSEKCLILFVELSRSLQSASPPRGARTRTFRPFETGETDFLWRDAAAIEEACQFLNYQ